MFFRDTKGDFLPNEVHDEFPEQEGEKGKPLIINEGSVLDHIEELRAALQAFKDGVYGSEYVSITMVPDTGGNLNHEYANVPIVDFNVDVEEPYVVIRKHGEERQVHLSVIRKIEPRSKFSRRVE